MADPRPILHLAAIAGSCRSMMERLGCASARELINLVQGLVGRRFRVTGNATLIEAPEDDERGGRNDDARRAADFQRALANDRVAAVVALRGGAWLTRILPRIDFDVLPARTNRVAVFGFSELTTVINIASMYPKAVCWYDLGPAFIPAGLSRYARGQKGPSRAAGDDEQNGEAVDHEQFRDHLAAFFTDVVAMIEGRGSSRPMRGRLVAGKLPRTTPVTIVGGTLSVLVSLLGTPYARGVFRTGRWLALEDVNEAPHRLDRMLAHLKLAGILDRSGGLLLGDFHEGDRDRTEQVLTSLGRILAKRSAMPILVSADFGHTWPMAPLLIGRRVELRRTGAQVELAVPWAKLATAPNTGN